MISGVFWKYRSSGVMVSRGDVSVVVGTVSSGVVSVCEEETVVSGIDCEDSFVSLLHPAKRDVTIKSASMLATRFLFIAFSPRNMAISNRFHTLIPV